MDFPHFSLILIFFCCVALSEQCTRHGVSCPTYTVIAKHADYEERQYPSLTWASASAKAKSRSEVSRKLIKLIYAYLGGENDEEQVMEMMVPVRTTKIPGQNENTYIMSIALAPEYQENPPNPDNIQVTVVKEPPKIYFARSFGGLIRDESRWDQEVQTLRNALQGGDTADTTFFYWSVYDSPWQTETDRLNEVWLSPAENTSE